MTTDYPGDLLVHLASFAALSAQLRRGRPGAFEAAARELGVDRSVLRRRLQTLESWFGAALFEGRGVGRRPTAAGVRLAEKAARLLEQAAELRDPAGAARRLVVACTGTITSELLPRVLVVLERRPRPVQLVVRRAGGALCERLVREGEVDLGVVRADAPPRGLASCHLADDRLWFVVPADHPLAKASRPGLAEMARVPLVMFGEASRTRARVMERLAPFGASIRVEVEGRSAALAYVEAGVGATFVSLLPGHRPAPRDGGTGVRCHDVTALFARGRFFVVGRHDRFEEPLVDGVVKVIRRQALGRAIRPRDEAIQ